MEYIEGVTLAEVLDRESPLPIERVVRITTQTANALAAAHSLEIVHRDLKPSNIMLIDNRGSDLWSKMFSYYNYKRDEFLAHYHKRSNVCLSDDQKQVW